MGRDEHNLTRTIWRIQSCICLTAIYLFVAILLAGLFGFPFPASFAIMCASGATSLSTATVFRILHIRNVIEGAAPSAANAILRKEHVRTRDHIEPAIILSVTAITIFLVTA